MVSPSDFRLRVTAGTSYDPTTHVRVRVNDAAPVHLAGPGADVWLNVRIKNYRAEEAEQACGDNNKNGDADADDDVGAPPAASSYFDAPPHKQNDDTYGIGLWLVPRRPPASESSNGAGANVDAVDSVDADATDISDAANAADTADNADSVDADADGISGADLQWGNDFDEPIRDRLPPGFGAALRLVRWWIDPGLEGDPYADQPYLYGPALSSFNRVYAALAGDGSSNSDNNGVAQSDTGMPVHPARGLWFGEGGDAAGRAWRAAIGCPGAGCDGDTDDTDDTGNKARMKWALSADAKARWTWRYGCGYGLDFYNGYLDFDELALRLPGFHMPLLRFWDGRQSLRYVLRHRQTGDVYLVVMFQLVRVRGGDEEEDDGDNDSDNDEGKGDVAGGMSARATPTPSAPETDRPSVRADDVD